MSARNLKSEEIEKWLSLMAKQAGDTEPIRYRKMWHTDVPSIQGAWTPWTHKNPAELHAGYPNEELGEKLDIPETATEKLLRLYGKTSANESKKE
jgi:large subunit ribosomal protein L43